MALRRILRNGLPLLVLGLMVIGATCQAPPPVEATPGGAALATVTAVSVLGDNQIQITGDSALQGFPMVMEDPLGVAVDVRGAITSPGLSQEMEGMGMISRVEVKALGDLAPPAVRVIAYVDKDVNYSLEPKGTSLVLTLVPAVVPIEPEQAAEEGNIPYEETRDELERLLAGQPPSPVSATSAPMPTAPVEYYGPETPSAVKYPPLLPAMPPPNMDGTATVVGDIFYRVGEDRVQIMILTNGMVGDFLDFDIVSPPKVVVDLWGLRASTPKKVFPLESGGIKQVRIGPHYDKTRVVVDCSGSLPAYDVKRTSSGVVVTIFKAKHVPGGINYQVYTTGSGESLRSIAQRQYGNPQNWPRLASANRQMFTPDEMKNMLKNDGAVILGENLEIKVPVR